MISDDMKKTMALQVCKNDQRSKSNFALYEQ